MTTVTAPAFDLHAATTAAVESALHVDAHRTAAIRAINEAGRHALDTEAGRNAARAAIAEELSTFPVRDIRAVAFGLGQGIPARDRVTSTDQLAWRSIEWARGLREQAAEREAVVTDYVQAPAPWTTNGPTEIGPGQTVVRWTHPGGAIVDDNTRNVPADLDLDAEELAETAFVGWHGTAFEQFPTFEAAARYATAGELT